jgi:PadR family transcriptional regulator, regulatory protein AphA
MPTQPADELTPTARSILGYLSLQERSGYEIRQAARRNLAWKVSDGQLYPQLANLHGAGLIEAAGPADEVHARQRWRLTPAGHQALEKWVLSEADQLVVRDENLTKLLFADQFGPDAVLALLRRRRAEFAELRQTLLAITPGGSGQPADEEAGRLGPGLAQSYGLDFAALNIDWCDRAIAAVTKQHQPDS